MSPEVRTELTAQYPRITERQWDIISDEAYERGHSAGQGEVDSYARDIAYFVNRILEA